ncbi:trypsin-like peptidase domain-containing protein [Micromonospora sp. NPDC023737]|uniref:S1C family serine protease n=1 Tax=unclassified Micromonospora TaxID=2617518 RepID=UPI0033C19940
MTEYESDPQRRPAPADAEPSHLTAELPRVERAQSDSPTTDPGAAPAARDTDQPAAPAAVTPEPAAVAGTGADAARDADATVSMATPSGANADADATQPVTTPAGVNADADATVSMAAPAGVNADADATQPVTTAGTGYQPHAGTPTYAGHPAPGQPGHHVPGQPMPGQPGHHVPGQHMPGQHGYPQPAAGYPGGHWYPHQQSGWAGGGQPGAGTQPYGQQPGQALPPWAVNTQPDANPGAPRMGRIAKFAGAGVVMLALMLGSGVGGGALALALDGDGGGITRTYSAAPVINSADLPRIAASVQDSVVSIATENGEGSGVILTADGYVLSNNHVVASADGDTVRVIFADGTNAEAKIVGTDPKTDLAVVKAKGVSNLKAAKFGDSDGMQVGDQVLALGSPLGLQGSVTAGILSARDRTIQAGDGPQQDPRQAASSIAGLLQTDAPINPGNSGGALVNTRGEVIGINTAIATSGQSTGNIGVGFAIPSNKAKDVAGKLQRGEKVSHPSLGVSVNMAEGGGALVAAVTPGSAAERAGLQRGDVITRFGDTPINDSDDLVGAVQGGKVGDRVEVHYKRNGAEATATVTLTETS